MLLPLLFAWLAPLLQDAPVETLDELPVLGFLFDQDPAPSPGNLIVYDLSDLIDDHLTVQPKVLEARAAEREQFIEVLRSRITPKARQAAQFEFSDSRLLVVGDDTVHSFVRNYLTAQRQNLGATFIVSMTMLKGQHGMFDGVVGKGSSVLFEDQDEPARALELFKAHATCEVLAAPQLAIQPRTRATISTTSQVSYVSDYELRIVQPGDQTILDPIIGVVEDGMSAELRIVPMPGGSFDVECKVEWAVLERPLKSERVRRGAGEGFEVEITKPVVETIRIDSLLGLVPGTAALLVTTSEDRTLDFATLLTFDRIELPRVEPNPRVDGLFAAMRERSYGYRWFPPLEWSDIPSLMHAALRDDAVRSFPTSPLSDIRPPEVITGVVALWLVEGLREEGHIPSFVPVLVESGRPLDASPTKQRELLKSARTAYEVWYQSLETGQGQEFDGCPLELVGLEWY